MTRRAVSGAIVAVVMMSVVGHAASGQSVPSRLGVVVGVVFDSLVRVAPLAGAEVVMVESGRATMTDAAGRFRFDSVAAGTMRLTFYHAVLDSLGVGAAPVNVTVPDSGDVKVTLATPTASTVMRALCPAANAATGVVIGRARDVDDRTPLVDAEVVAAWSEWHLGNGTLAPTERQLVARTDSSGAFRLCGLPVDIPIIARAVSGDQATGLVQLDLTRRRFLTRDFSVSRRDTAARVQRSSGTSGAGLSEDSAVLIRGTASVSGVVRTPDNRPVSNAQTSLLDEARSTRTDSTGHFRLTGVPAGTRTLVVRALGFAPTMIDVDLPTNGEREITLVLNRNAQTLAAVNVLGDGTVLDNTGFEKRRQTYAFGRFITADQIRRRGVFDLHTLLKGMPEFSYGGMMRAPFGLGACTPVLFVDGDLVGKVDIIDEYRPRAVRGIEVYVHPDAAPLFYRDPKHQCGSVVLWTQAPLRNDEKKQPKE